VTQAPTPKSATYQAQAFDITFYDAPARAFVYHSRALDKKKVEVVPMAVEREEIQRLIKTLAHT
jgi:hypothetical protein